MTKIVCERLCVTKIVYTVCERLCVCVAKLRVKDCVCVTKMCVKDCVRQNCVCDKVLCETMWVEKLCGTTLSVTKFCVKKCVENCVGQRCL